MWCLLQNFFGNEVSVITQEAYDRDSSFWKHARPEPLTEDQKKVVAYRDSIEAVHRNPSLKGNLRECHSFDLFDFTVWGNQGNEIAEMFNLYWV